MKTFNRRTIKPYKGKMIVLKYKSYRNIDFKNVKYNADVSGIIIDIKDNTFCFKPNNEEIKLNLKYNQIQSIEILNRKYEKPN